MNGILVSFLVLACSFWITAQVLGGIQLGGLKGTLLGAALFGGVNAVLGWLLVGVVTVVPLEFTFLALFGTRWVVNGLLLVLLDTSTDLLIIKDSGTAFVGGLLVTAIGTTGDYLFRVL
jgi:uncharacterized membrane protein YvlD (DUF360 family)